MAQAFHQLPIRCKHQGSRNPQTLNNFENSRKIVSMKSVPNLGTLPHYNSPIVRPGFPNSPVNSVRHVFDSPRENYSFKVNQPEKCNIGIGFWKNKIVSDIGDGKYREKTNVRGEAVNRILKEAIGVDDEKLNKFKEERNKDTNQQNSFSTSLELKMNTNSQMDSQAYRDKLLEMEIAYDKKQYKFETKIEKLTTENQSLKAANKSLSEQLQKYKEENLTLKQANSSIKLINQQMQRELADHRQNRIKFQKQNIELKLIKKTSFEDMLKEQFEQTNEIRGIMQDKNMKIVALQNENQELQRKLVQHEQDVSVDKLKLKAEINRLEKQQDMIVLNKDNKIRELELTLKNIQKKIDRIVKQNQQKDQFISRYLTKRCKTVQSEQQIREILSQYIAQFSTQELTAAICTNK